MTVLLNSIGLFGSTYDWLIIAGLVVLLFGGAKIPQVMRSLGSGIGEFQQGLNDTKRKLSEMGNPTEDEEKKDHM